MGKNKNKIVNTQNQNENHSRIPSHDHCLRYEHVE